MKGRAISKEHEDASESVARMLQTSGFEVVDREVNVSVTDPATGLVEGFNLDVCAIYRDAMLVVETKTGSPKFKELVLSWERKRAKISNFKTIRVVSSRWKNVHTNRIRHLSCLAVVPLFTSVVPGPDYKDRMKVSNFRWWDSQALEYYVETARVLRKWTKYEIIRDVGLRPKETQQSITVSAIKFSQPGGEGYLLALKPYELLKMSYVHRRSKGDTLAYQRIIKQQKVESMAAFLKSGKSTLPNDVILSIDEDAKDLVHYDTKTMKLTLPGGYCTAWVVDGQHRLYGFNETKFGKDAALEDFEIPVVAFVALGLEKQTAMFVDINNNQKRIDSTLLADFSTVLKDLSRKETWPSLLAKGLSERGPFEGMVRIFELKSKKNVKPITLAGLSRYALARNLLAPKISKGKIVGYSGPLYRYSKFDWELSFNNSKNQESFNDQLNVLNEFFTAVKVHLKRKWTDTERYGATTYSGVNALLLVLNRILEQRKSFTEQSMYKLLEPLKNSRINWRRSNTRKFTNYAGFIELANKIMKALNKVNKDQLNYYLPKVKSPA